MASGLWAGMLLISGETKCKKKNNSMLFFETTKFINMKTLICLLTVWIGLAALSCSKKNGSGDYCYRCHITGGSPYQDRYLDTCMENESQGFSFEDANGNDLNSFCERK